MRGFNEYSLVINTLFPDRDHVAVVEALAMHGEWRKGVALVRFRGITCNLLHLAASFGCLAVLRYLLSHTVRLG